MRIANGVEMLELEMNMMGHKNIINPTLLYDENGAVLVDVGMPGQAGAIQTEMEKAGVPFNNLHGVIFTHQDIDHIGGIQDLLKTLGKPIDVYAHAEEKPYVEGDKRPIKMTPERVSQMLERIPLNMRDQVEDLFLNPPTVKVTKTVSDSEILPFFGGVQVLFTPGHTPGHISLYHLPSKTLITGDAMVGEGGKILGLNEQATFDVPRALKSQKKFAELDIENVICYHGGWCKDNVNEQIRQLTK